jgi:hypothetical protein
VHQIRLWRAGLGREEPRRIQREFFQDEVGPMVDIVFAGCNLAEGTVPLTPAGGAAASARWSWVVVGSRPSICMAPVYGWFTEGFDTADLQEARALLDALS